MKRIPLLVLFVLISVLWPSPARTQGVLELIPPSALASSRDAADYPFTEAGFSAYTNAGRAIDLAGIRPLFRTIERQTSDYLLGSCPAPDYDENWDVHVYVHRNGWILSYLLYSEPAVKAVDWRHYDGSADLPLLLDGAMRGIRAMIGAPTGQFFYYDFRNPSANAVMLFADYVNERDASDSMQFQYPASFTVHERAWLHATYGFGSSSYRLNGVLLNSHSNSYQEWAVTKYGTLPATQVVVFVQSNSTA